MRPVTITFFCQLGLILTTFSSIDGQVTSFRTWSILLDVFTVSIAAHFLIKGITPEAGVKLLKRINMVTVVLIILVWGIDLFTAEYLHR